MKLELKMVVKTRSGRKDETRLSLIVARSFSVHLVGVMGTVVNRKNNNSLIFIISNAARDG